MPYLVLAAVLALWGAFGILLFTAPGALEGFREWELSQSILVRGVLWALLLPWMTALAIWESSWELWLRLVTIGGAAVATVYLFLPKTS